ncbi:MAG: FxsA family protein [Halioglobus sp.]
MRFAIILLPWLELFTLIELGIKTSAATALAYVFITMVLGLAILRFQGREMFERLRQGRGGIIIGPQLLLDDMALGFAGILLIIPGILSDVAALIIMCGPVRRRLVAAWLKKARSEGSRHRQGPGEHETIEGTFRRLDDEL